MTQLLELAAITHARMLNEKISPIEHAALARAFCLIDERIRIRKGIPLPGQLKPDELPKKWLKLKRAGKLIETGDALDPDDEPVATTKTPKPPKHAKVATTIAQPPDAAIEEKKESLNNS